jgi:hypothetical protein
MIEWKECEHEVKDMASFHDPNTMVTLRNCSLLKFLKTQRMRKQTILLEHLIGMWNTNDQVFHVRPHTLGIEMEDVYFLIGLSKRGEPIMLIGHQDTEMMTDEYIAQYCRDGTRKRSGKIPIKDIMDRPLCTILFTITKLAGSTWMHLASKS